MNMIFLTQVSGFLKPFAWVMGEILNAIYKFVSLFGIANIALCIVIFTIVVKMLMLPLTVKQQKFAKVSAKMNPELQALQEKYKNADRSNQAVMQKMTQEQQELYQKYGVSPFGGCLPLLIMLPILFALYRVIYAVPAYVDDVNVLYKDVSNAIITELDDTEYEDIYTEAIKEFYGAKKVALREEKDDVRAFNETDLIDVFSVFNTEVWEAFRTGAEIDDCDKWNQLATSSEFKAIMASQDKTIDTILDVNGLFGRFNILDSPGLSFPEIIIPILAALLQFLQGKMSTAANKDKNKKNDDPMTNSMQTMNTIMPIMSGVFCIMLPIGVGIYWVANSAVTIVQQFAINKYFDHVGIDEIVAESAEKKKKSLEKYGVHSQSEGMSNIAKSSTKSIATMKTENAGTSNNSKPSSPKSKKNSDALVSDKKREELKKQYEETGTKSIASIANLLKNDDMEE